MYKKTSYYLSLIIIIQPCVVTLFKEYDMQSKLLKQCNQRWLKRLIKDNRWKWGSIIITLCGWRSDHSFVHQGYEKSVNLYWKLGWRAYVFETLKQMGTMPRKQLVWREASPLLLHIHEQVPELTPKTQIFQWQAYKLVQSSREQKQRQTKSNE